VYYSKWGGGGLGKFGDEWKEVRGSKLADHWGEGDCQISRQPRGGIGEENKGLVKIAANLDLTL